MAVRLHFIVEGQTEETFVNRVLCPHLATLSIWTKARRVMTSHQHGVKYRGGIMRYAQAKSDIKAWIMEDQNPDARFTTMFDLYHLPTDFPGYKDATQISDPYRRIGTLEDALRGDIADLRFIPYLQLHEFEALLLSDPQKLDLQFPDRSTGIQQLVELASAFSSPELVNNGDKTTPSKRITDKIPEYGKRKQSAGPIVAEKIGLPTLRSKCEHFGEWLSSLEALV